MNNARFYYAAYTVAVVAYVVYTATLWWRGRQLDRRAAALDAHRHAPGRGTGV